MHARVEAFLPPQALRHLPPTTHIPSQPAHGSGQASTPPQAGEGLGPPLPNPTLRPAHPLSCQAGLQRYLSQGALSSLIRKVVTGTLAAKGGGAEGCHKAEENQMPATSQATGPHLCQGLWPGKGQRQWSKYRIALWDSPLGLRAQSRDLPVIPCQACRLPPGWTRLTE